MSGGGWENVEYYDKLASKYHLFFEDFEGSMEEEGQWLHDILAESGTRTVLDASCGTGRQALPLAQRGYTVVGADPSSPMLELARAEARRRGLRIDFLQAPFSDLPDRLDQRFDAVIALGNGLCNLAVPEEIHAALRALRQCCRDGGVCVIGTKEFERIRRERPTFHGHQVVVTPEGRVVLFELWSYSDPILAVTAFLLTEGRGGMDSAWQAASADTREYMLLPEQLRHMAHECGFRSVYRLDHPSEAVFLLQG